MAQSGSSPVITHSGSCRRRAPFNPKFPALGIKHYVPRVSPGHQFSAYLAVALVVFIPFLERNSRPDRPRPMCDARGHSQEAKKFHGAQISCQLFIKIHTAVQICLENLRAKFKMEISVKCRVLIADFPRSDVWLRERTRARDANHKWVRINFNTNEHQYEIKRLRGERNLYMYIPPEKSFLGSYHCSRGAPLECVCIPCSGV